MMNTNVLFNGYGSQKLIILPGADLLESLKVKGIDGAKSFTTQPNTRVPLFDSDDDYIYLVTTDENGNKSDITRISFQISPIPKPEELFVSKEDFNQLKEDIGNVQQLVRQLLESNALTATADDSAKSDKQYSKNNGKPRNEGNAFNNKSTSANG